MAISVLDHVAYITTLIDAVDTAGDVFTDQAATIVEAIQPAVYVSLAIYVVLWGWAMMRGVVTDVVWDSITRLIRIGVVVGLAMNAGLYATYVSDFVWEAPDAMMEVITGLDTDMFIILNQVISVAFKLGNDYWADATKFGIDGMPNLMLAGLGIANWATGVTIGVVVAGTLLLAKFALSILLAVGPIFIVLILFESTKRLFDAWLGQVIKYMVIIVLLSLVAHLVFKVLLDALAIYIAAYFASLILPGILSPGPLEGLGVVSLFLICTKIFREVQGIADALGRSIAINLQTGAPRK